MIVNEMDAVDEADGMDEVDVVDDKRTHSKKASVCSWLAPSLLFALLILMMNT